MKKTTIFLLVLSVALTFAATINSAVAYLTSYAHAEGGHVVSLGYSTEIEEDVYSGAKHVVIRNNANSSFSVYVRARVFAVCDVSCAGEGWYDGEDGYWYYGGILKPGEETAELKVEFVAPQGEEHFNVIVVYESAPVQYENGDPYADWTLTYKESE